MFTPFAFIQDTQVATPPMYMDPDALLFITASGITDSTQQSAINQLVLGLKTDNIWTKMQALYPFVGGTSTTHKYNLKDPRDLDAAYRIQFNGGWTHNANGIQGDGGSSNANTFAATNTTAIPNRSNHWSLYQRQIANNGSGGWTGALDYPGAFAQFGMVGSSNQNLGLGLQNYVFFNSPAVPVYPAFYNGTVVNSSNSALYINGTSSYSFNSATSFVNTFDFYLGAMWFNGAPYDSHNAQVAFASLGNSLTSTDAANFYTRVQGFQTTLGRYVGTPIILPPITSPPTDPDAQAFITAAGISNATQQSAINTLVLDLKAYSLWTKMTAIYPFVGGTATTHKFNLKDPRDVDAAYRIIFNGGWTHDSNGIQGAGNGYADTKASMTNGAISNRSNHWSVYQTITGTSAYNGMYTPNNYMFGFSSGHGKYVGLQDFSFAANETTGFWNGTVTSVSNGVLYKNGTNVYSINNPGSILESYNFYLGAMNYLGSANFYNTARFAFASLGGVLDATNAANLYTAVQKFQTTLGRQL
jgi:hypothetical protein